MKKTIREFPRSTELHHFGYMGFKDFPMVEMKNLEAHEHYKRFQLIVFNHYMVTVEHYCDEHVGTSIWFPVIIKKDQKRFSNYYKIKDFDVISSPKKVKHNWIIEFKAFNDFNLKVDEKKSLSFRFSKEAEANMFREYLQATQRCVLVDTG